MEKLKSYISALIKALLNKVPESVSPKRAYSNQQISGDLQQVVSPIDGWAALTVSNAISNTAYISAHTSNGFSHQHSISSTQHSASLHIPVRKGDTVTVGQGGFASGAWLNFFERVGGGINRLLSQALQCVRGGGLCLNSSITFAPPLIRRLQELARAIRLIPYLFLLKTHHGLQQSLQLMVGAAYIFQENSTAFIYQRITLSEVFLQPRGLMKVAPATLQDVSRFAKEKQLLALLEELQNLIITSCTSQNGKCLSNVFAKEVCYG